ncbi:hypothetical protein B0H14DRAFT_2623249 [Mycena olivaceomarginata]|nr:hypothetical protein B0H14DRAFT_2623249 [Mycena olivaceomarginata]
MFPYLSLGILSASSVVYALRRRCPAVTLDRLDNTITAVEEILTHAKAKCMRDYLALFEAETRFLRTKLAVSRLHSRLLEARHMPGWKTYLRDIFTISRALVMLEREVRDIQTSCWSLIEAAHQHKLTEDIRESQEIVDGVTAALLFRCFRTSGIETLALYPREFGSGRKNSATMSDCLHNWCSQMKRAILGTKNKQLEGGYLQEMFAVVRAGGASGLFPAFSGHFTGRGFECATMKPATALRVRDGCKNQKRDRKLPGIIAFPHSDLHRTTTCLIGVQVLSSPRCPRNARVVAGLYHRKATIAQEHSQWKLFTLARLLPVPDINNHSGGEGKGNDFAGMSLIGINTLVCDHEDVLGGLDISEFLHGHQTQAEDCRETFNTVSELTKAYRKQRLVTIGCMVRSSFIRIKIKLLSLAPQVGNELERGLNNVLMADKINQETCTGIVGLQYTVQSPCLRVCPLFDEDLIKFTSVMSGKRIDVILTSKDVWIPHLALEHRQGTRDGNHNAKIVLPCVRFSTFNASDGNNIPQGSSLGPRPELNNPACTSLSRVQGFLNDCDRVGCGHSAESGVGKILAGMRDSVQNTAEDCNTYSGGNHSIILHHCARTAWNEIRIPRNMVLFANSLVSKLGVIPRNHSDFYPRRAGYYLPSHQLWAQPTSQPVRPLVQQAVQLQLLSQ